MRALLWNHLRTPLRPHYSYHIADVAAAAVDMVKGPVGMVMMMKRLNFVGKAKKSFVVADSGWARMWMVFANMG